ncbi:hypothetical protein Bca52824_029729 [Brassica carinata]|uniref:Crooked neck protein n=1 Tax=Brassica carinata TaxID=52824 RepID=A0A8X7S7E9_BRACI|nr:hypothetical protein Bca52824_029729 [Brassica carinata]
MASFVKDTQLLREARERQEPEILPSQLNITDSAELSDYRLRRRKEFEDRIRRPGPSTQVWLNYARWEESQKDYARARSVEYTDYLFPEELQTLSLNILEAAYRWKNQKVNAAWDVFKSFE